MTALEQAIQHGRAAGYRAKITLLETPIGDFVDAVFLDEDGTEVCRIEARDTGFMYPSEIARFKRAVAAHGPETARRRERDGEFDSFLTPDPEGFAAFLDGVEAPAFAL